MSAHTPGPWEVVAPGKWYIGSAYGVQAKTPEGPGFPTPAATGYYAMCSPPPHGKNKEGEQKANAYLIAAAPDMLAALISLRKIVADARADEEFNANTCDAGGIIFGDIASIAMEMADAAIAAAEGR